MPSSGRRAAASNDTWPVSIGETGRCSAACSCSISCDVIRERKGVPRSALFLTTSVL